MIAPTVAIPSPNVPPCGKPRFQPKYIPEITYPTPRPHNIQGPKVRDSSVFCLIPKDKDFPQSVAAAERPAAGSPSASVPSIEPPHELGRAGAGGTADNQPVAVGNLKRQRVRRHQRQLRQVQRDRYPAQLVAGGYSDGSRERIHTLRHQGKGKVRIARTRRVESADLAGIDTYRECMGCR